MQQYPNANKQLTEDNFEGNICRCTGDSFIFLRWNKFIILGFHCSEKYNCYTVVVLLSMTLTVVCPQQAFINKP